MRALATFALVLCAAGLARAQGLTLNFRDAEIGAIVTAVARATGQRFIHEAELRGRVTIILEDEVSPEEALEVLNAALLTSGYATIRGPDGSWKVLPIEAAQGAAPWMQHGDAADSVRIVTTLLRLESANAAELARVLGGRMRSSIVLPYPPTNGLIISAAEDRLREMLTVVRALDQASASELRVFPLRYAEAGALAAQIDFALQPGDGPDIPWRVTVDERTNSLVVQGAPTRVREVRDLIELLDVPSRAASGYQVVRVVNAEAEAIATHLRALEFDENRPAAASAVSARSGIDVVTDEATNSLVIRAGPAAFAEIARVIGELDRIPARVAIELYVWDVETLKGLTLGFDALIPLVVPRDPDDTVAFTTIGNAASLLAPADPPPFIARFTRSPLLIPIIGPDGNPTTLVVPEGAGQITAAQGEVTIRALTTPYLLATAGEEQTIFSGDQVPIPVSSGTTTSTSDVASSAQNPFITDLAIQREDVGVDLRVTPIAVSDDLVSLELHIEVSTVAQALTVLNEQSQPEGQGPTLRKFQLDANVRLTNGAVMLVGAAPADLVESGETGVPFFKDIPILGWFFRSTRDLERSRRLVAAVKASQIHSPEQQRAESIVRRLAFERHAERTATLRALTSSPYAVYVATRKTLAEARAVADELEGLAGTPAIAPSQGIEGERYDVYLIGFDEISDLGPLTVLLRERGFVTRLEILGPPTT
ncbi:MAG: secretin N-terminal domain-containing protein [Myxococcota bacterium]